VLDFHALPIKTQAVYDDFYQIRVDDGDVPYLDRELFVKAINYLSAQPSPRAVDGPIYQSNSNNVTLLLESLIKAKYIIMTQ